MVNSNLHTEGKSVFDRWGSSIKGKTSSRQSFQSLYTGASQGSLGALTAVCLAAAHPSQLIILARSESKVRSVVKSINKTSPQTHVMFVALELNNIGRHVLAVVDKLFQMSFIHFIQCNI